MSKRAFLICPVRGHEMSETAEIVRQLEAQGWQVHWPHRDTNQSSSSFDICLQNLNAIRLADCVFVVFDPQSYGSHFDLGMAFALGKRIHVIGVPDATEGKSFANLIRAWADENKL